jgi:hypothetical protein
MGNIVKFVGTINTLVYYKYTIKTTIEQIINLKIC